MVAKETTTVPGAGRRTVAIERIAACKRLITAAISMCFASAPAWSNPTAPQVVNGSASFSQVGKLLTVSNSSGAIINWNNFSIAPGETTRFNQTSASSSVLNRVLANDPSVLLGTLSSNGRVWLVNPAGIMVGPGARVDVGGFVASTLNVRDEDFLAGRLNFGAMPNAGSVVNYGQITTPSGGSVYLVAPAVINSGIINAPNGEIILAAGQTVQLVDTGTPGVKVNITGAEGNLTNLGQIVAEAGFIGSAGVLVKNSGALNASSVVSEGGRVFLRATKRIELADTSVISANGIKGGNIVAKTEEDGQLIGALIARGEVSARGNGTLGSGGFVETSAAHVDIGNVSIRTGGGQWLIDPGDVLITSTGDNVSAGGNFSPTSSVDVTTLVAALNNGNSVTIDTAGGASGPGDITVGSAISAAPITTGAALTLNAWHNIAINQPITATGSNTLNLGLNANIGVGGGSSSSNSAISLNGGTLNFSGGNFNLSTGASIVNASVVGTGAAVIAIPNGNDGTLDGVTLGGNLWVNPNASLTIRNGLTLNSGKVYLGDGVTNAVSNMLWDGTQTIGGTGEVVFNSPGGTPSLTTAWHTLSPFTLTLGSAVTVRSATPGWFVVGSYGPMLDSVINNGTFSADAAGSTLVLATPGTLTNNGTLRATAGLCNSTIF